MQQTIHLTEEEVKGKSLIAFYDLIADKLSHSKKVQYDCTKIWVSEPIQDHIFEHYYSQSCTVEELGALWLCLGPKTDKSLTGLTVIVQDGFFKEGSLCQQK